MNFNWTGCESNYPELIGIGICIDENNNPGCLFDGGDCCGNNVDTTYCTECVCYEDLDCHAPLEMIANGVCNDETNNAECNFDGGDCCGACIISDYCTQCICHPEGAQTLDISCKQQFWFTLVNNTKVVYFLRPKNYKIVFNYLQIIIPIALALSVYYFCA